MKKIQILGLVLFALFALASVAAGSASAEEALWLISGAEVTTLTSVEIVGELLLEDNKAFGGKAAVTKCSGILDGSIGPGGEDEITEVLTLAGASVLAKTLGASGTSVACEAESICSGTESMAWPNKLPIQTLLELMSNGQILDTLTGGGWTTLCLVLGVNSEDECHGTTTALEENMTGGVLGIFNSESEHGECQVGGAGSGVVEGSGETLSLTGLEVTVSSP